MKSPFILASRGMAWVVQRRIQSEMARREGRAQAINVTVGCWRDSAGNLWQPDWKLVVHLPSLELSATTWLITHVEFNRDESGTRAELTIMPLESAAQYRRRLHVLVADELDVEEDAIVGRVGQSFVEQARLRLLDQDRLVCYLSRGRLRPDLKGSGSGNIQALTDDSIDFLESHDQADLSLRSVRKHQYDIA